MTFLWANSNVCEYTGAKGTGSIKLQDNAVQCGKHETLYLKLHELTMDEIMKDKKNVYDSDDSDDSDDPWEVYLSTVGNFYE